MDERKLEYFIASIEESSFEKAAKRCHVSQTAISRQLAAMEMELGVSLLALEVTDDGLLIEEEGVEKVLDVDTVIYAIGQKPYREEASQLSKCAPEFYQVGDCVAPRNIYFATSEAYQAASDIGRY